MTVGFLQTTAIPGWLGMGGMGMGMNNMGGMNNNFNNGNGFNNGGGAIGPPGMNGTPMRNTPTSTRSRTSNMSGGKGGNNSGFHFVLWMVD